MEPLRPVLAGQLREWSSVRAPSRRELEQRLHSKRAELERAQRELERAEQLLREVEAREQAVPAEWFG